MGADTVPKAGDGYWGRVAAGGGVDSRDAVAKPTGTYSRRPPPDATRPGKPKTQSLVEPWAFRLAIRIATLFGRRECLPTTAHALPVPTAVTTHAAASPVPIALATAKATAFAA